jgi:hypothetical protein
MIRIFLRRKRRRRLLSLRYRRLSATGNGKHRAVELALAHRKDSFMADDSIGIRVAYCGALRSILKSRRHAAVKRSRATFFKGQGNASGNSITERTLAGKDKLTSTTLLSDQRGTVAFETPIVYFFLMFSLLLPLADLASAGFQFLFAWQALRNFGQYVQYNPPANVVTDWASSTSALTQMSTQLDPRYPINNIQLVCGVDLCSSSNTSTPRYYSYTTTVTLSPIVLGPVFNCSSPCSFTLSYSAPYQ